MCGEDERERPVPDRVLLEVVHIVEFNFPPDGLGPAEPLAFGLRISVIVVGMNTVVVVVLLRLLLT